FHQPKSDRLLPGRIVFSCSNRGWPTFFEQNRGFGVCRTLSARDAHRKSLSSVSPTRLGFAFPLEAFMTWPFRKLIAAAFPARKSSTDFGLARTTSWQIASIAP